MHEFCFSQDPLAVRQLDHAGLVLSYIDCQRQTIMRLVVEDLQLDNQVRVREMKGWGKCV